MKVALAQINPRIGDFDGNFEKIKHSVLEAKKKKAQLVVFPELCLSGYPPRDLVESADFINENIETLQKVAALARDILVIVGCLLRNPQPEGLPLSNAAVLCENGQMTRFYYKKLLPTYDVFDEARHFEPGGESGVWTLSNGMRVGISICEDAWNDEVLLKSKRYRENPLSGLEGLDLLINLSASPFEVGKRERFINTLRKVAIRHQTPFCVVNMVGGNDELVFSGESFVLDHTGELVVLGKSFEEDLVCHELKQTTKEKNILHFPVDDEEKIIQALCLGIRDYVWKCGFKKVLLGLSGGIDSALTAVLAVKALGPDCVLGVMMPSPYSSPGSVDDSRTLAERLGITVREIPIAEIYRSFRGLFGREEAFPDLADENLQARIRGNLLMTLSNRENRLLLTTGNKSEMALGYCTLYGDMCGALAVIGDLYKTEVYQLARYLNRGTDFIPENTFQKAPSAELRPNQTDQDSLPPYELLDSMIRLVIEEGFCPSDLVARGFDTNMVQEVFLKYRMSEYKRRQAAPVLKISKKSFGAGRRIPIAMKSRVLSIPE